LVTDEHGVTCIGHKSKTERPRKTKIGIEICQVTRDSHTEFNINRSRSHGQLTLASKMCSIFVVDKPLTFTFDIQIKYGQFLSTDHEWA